MHYPADSDDPYETFTSIDSTYKFLGRFFNYGESLCWFWLRETVQYFHYIWCYRKILLLFQPIFYFETKTIIDLFEK